MAPAPAPDQGFRKFSAPTPAPKLAIFLLWLRLRFLLIYILLSSAPLRSKMCYKLLIFVYQKSIAIIAKPKKIAFKPAR